MPLLNEAGHRLIKNLNQDEIQALLSVLIFLFSSNMAIEVWAMGKLTDPRIFIIVLILSITSTLLSVWRSIKTRVNNVYQSKVSEVNEAATLKAKAVGQSYEEGDLTKFYFFETKEQTCEFRATMAAALYAKEHRFYTFWSHIIRGKPLKFYRFFDYQKQKRLFKVAA